MTTLPIVTRLPIVLLALSTWYWHPACLGRPLGPTIPVHVAADVAAGPGSSASGVGPGPHPADQHPLGGH